MVRVSSQCSHVGRSSLAIRYPWVSLLWPILNRTRDRSQWRSLQEESESGDISEVISLNLLGWVSLHS